METSEVVGLAATGESNVRYELEKKLSVLVKRLKTAFGDQLVSVILYGSAAAGDWNEHASDLNVLCVLNRIGAPQLEKAEPVLRWWRQQDNPAPLLLTAEELQNSTDSFPMEFTDMREHRRVLYGADPIQALDIDRSYYRVQVEHELRTKQIRLRQKAAEAISNSGRLLRLLTDSLSTFCVLGRHALILSGNHSLWNKREIITALEQVMGTPLPAAREILAIRVSGNRTSNVKATAIFDEYLEEMNTLVRFVNALER